MKSITEVFSNSSPESTTACRWIAAEMEKIWIFSSRVGEKIQFPSKDTEKVFPSHLVYWRPKNNICRLPLTLNHWHNPFAMAPSSSSSSSSPRKFSISISPSCVRYGETRDKILWQFLPSSESHRDFFLHRFFPNSDFHCRKEADKRKSREKIFCNFLFHFIFSSLLPFCKKRFQSRKELKAKTLSRPNFFSYFLPLLPFFCLVCLMTWTFSTFSSWSSRENLRTNWKKCWAPPRALQLH